MILLSTKTFQETITHVNQTCIFPGELQSRLLYKNLKAAPPIQLPVIEQQYIELPMAVVTTLTVQVGDKRVSSRKDWFLQPMVRHIALYSPFHY